MNLSRIRIFKNFKGIIAPFMNDKLGLAGLLILSTIALLGISAPYLNLSDPNVMIYPRFRPPSLANPLGTDNLGRDMLSRIIWGARTSLAVGFIAASISVVIGVTLGGIAGYFGGLTDDIICRITDMFLMIPGFFLALFVVAIYGGNILYVIAVIGLLIWPSNARLMRAQVLSLREREFVAAAKVIGVNDFRILFNHIIPNAIQPLIANTILQSAGAVITEAGLSYLGLGDPNAISWGRMIYLGQNYLASYWWIAITPGLMVFLTVLSLHLIGDTLSRVFRPMGAT